MDTTNKNGIAKFAGTAIALIALILACLLGLSACNGVSSKAAATVNGTTISEDKVTDYIEQQREAMGYSDEESWAEYLAQSGYTVEDIRSQVIEGMIQEELMRQGASELGVSVDQSEIDEYIESTKASFDSEEAWQEALESAGYTEESLRSSYELNLLQQAVLEALDTEASDEELLETANMFASQYNGAKRSSHILVEDEATAQDVLAQLNAGTIDFAAAAQEFSTDSGSAVNGGDVGWDALNSFVTEYQEALDALEVGQVSGIVQSDYGYHIITVTDVFNAPETVTSLDQLPEDILSYISDSASQQSSYTAFSEWLQKLEDEGNIEINDMPSGLSYYVDLSKYDISDPDSEDADLNSEILD